MVILLQYNSLHGSRMRSYGYPESRPKSSKHRPYPEDNTDCIIQGRRRASLH